MGNRAKPRSTPCQESGQADHDVPRIPNAKALRRLAAGEGLGLLINGSAEMIAAPGQIMKGVGSGTCRAA